MTLYDKSALWDSILDEDMFKKIDIQTFKEQGANSRITQYNHKTHGLLFLKNILFQMASTFDQKSINLLDKIPNRHIGGGLSIDFNGSILDLDYLLALEEILFLQSRLGKIGSILEIGAGYGRTCHSILSLFPNISEYHILDFPSMLKLSKSYLKTVGKPENFQKIEFTPIENINKRQYDLIINIDSMQEMDQSAAESYLAYIDQFGSAFYSKNTVGKFNSELCGWQKSEGSELAMASGLLTQSINIFCPKDLQEAQSQFLTRFLPGHQWVVEKHSKSLPWSHYYQGLFIKNA